MHKHLLISLIFCLFFASSSNAQTQDTLLKVALDSVVVNAYGSKTLMATPAAVNKIGLTQLQRYANSNILQAVNATPGVRMEERSPGSYRLNIRGSSVRSPYGVRNVKIYYDGIPFTAPGGNSMLNMLGFYNIAGMEIIKGSGSSLYGAGTGGVVLFDAPQVRGNVQAGAD
ncbi:MAG: Plug domain-containing protein, partial [Pedobacter sp.]